MGLYKFYLRIYQPKGLNKFTIPLVNENDNDPKQDRELPVPPMRRLQGAGGRRASGRGAGGPVLYPGRRRPVQPALPHDRGGAEP